MARYTGPKCKLCRREGVKLFLKGTRCESEKCAVVRRHQVPGQHGGSRRRRTVSGYEEQLREKQKAKRIYGVLEKQFSNYVKRALQQKEVTGEVLVQTLELRLDNVVYRAGFALSRAQARQFVRFGLFLVNGKTVMTPSYQLKSGDVVAVSKKERISPRDLIVFPEWLKIDKEEMKIEILNVPDSEQLNKIASEINPQLIVEFYSR
ncbi:30S ribosomal protein S4 [candidate division WWE3 bacterium]|nr:30S ribosomal protein S4 [candidate division WWE3 bacterium]